MERIYKGYMRTEKEIRNKMNEFKEAQEIAFKRGFGDSYFLYKDLKKILQWVLKESDNE